jgi:hypothetical protein
MFAIEKNVPLASQKSYPFDQMEAGDSFLIPCTDAKKISQIRAQINNAKKRYPGKVISTRKEADGLRVWLLHKGFK